MLYTRKGDNGTTKTFSCDQRISKSSAIAEALGSLDEINSFLGLCKVKSYENNFLVNDKKIGDLVHTIQENLFVAQAELAGSPLNISDEKVKECEEIVNEIEKILPPIKTFFISGGVELGAMFDFARTIARRAERRVVQVSEEGVVIVSKSTRAYLNRLSSILYAFARLSSHLSGVQEQAPMYK